MYREKNNRKSKTPGGVLVTGATTGIGLAVVEQLAQKSYLVFGTYRQLRDRDRIEHAGGTPIQMDVTSVPSIIRARDQMIQKLGAYPLSGIVNNAGVVKAGPLEHLELEELRRVFEVNVFGVFSVCKAFLPLIRESRGRVINIGSVSGTFAMPFLGPYASSKFALEGLSDSLRRELMFADIPVVLIRPGSIRTPIWGKTPKESYDRFMDTPYRDQVTRFLQIAREARDGGLDASVVGKAVLRALTASRPPHRIVVADYRGAPSRWLQKLPSRWVDALIRYRMRAE